MDGSFFAYALIGALLGYIIGDFQRERRYRRDARANLALAMDRGAGNGSHADRNANIDGNGDTGADRDRDRNLDRAALGTDRRAARRAAVRGTDYGLSLAGASVGGVLRSADAPPVGKRRLEIDCF